MSSDDTEKLKKNFQEYIKERRNQIQIAQKKMEEIKNRASNYPEAEVMATMWERGFFLFDELYMWVSIIIDSIFTFVDRFSEIRQTIEYLELEVNPENKERVEELRKETDEYKRAMEELEKSVVKLMKREPPDIFG